MLGLFLSAALASSGPVVAVHYFENRTQSRDWDVLCKGLADMLVTDLVQVPGLTVVERARLETVLGELKLQQTKWFDRASAMKVGHLLGAGLIVTGQFVELKPTLTVEARVLDVKSGRVVVALRVSGRGEDFFALEQQLAAKLVEALMPGAQVESSAPRSADTALAYARSLDARDRGDAREATRRLGEVLREAPDFQLGKVRHAELVEFLARTTRAHDAELATVRRELVSRLKEVIARPEVGGPESAFCARALLAELALQDMLRAVGEQVSETGISVLQRRHHRVALEQVAQVAQHVGAIYQSVRRAQFNYSPVLCEGNGLLVVQREAPALAALQVKRPRAVRLTATLLGGTFIRLVAFGEAPPWSAFTFKIFPTLATRGAPTVSVAEARKDVDVALAQYAEDLKPTGTADWTDLAGQVDVLFGRPDAAIEKWQTFLTDNPRAAKWAAIKGRLGALLGTTEDARAFVAAAPKCSEGVVNLLSHEVQRVGWAEGAHGLERLAERLEKSCGAPDRPDAGRVLSSLYEHLFREAALWNECGLLSKAEKRLDTLQPGVEHRLARDFCEEER